MSECSTRWPCWLARKMSLSPVAMRRFFNALFFLQMLTRWPCWLARKMSLSRVCNAFFPEMLIRWPCWLARKMSLSPIAFHFLH
ncbi:hypothetical protein BJV82DRAFT_635351 [Fennellomyces sp. T-0311]|nr:hypothetical protein BJV82DRAFT_635351 [Fennellomyces sp. T-0311]